MSGVIAHLVSRFVERFVQYVHRNEHVTFNIESKTNVMRHNYTVADIPMVSISQATRI